MERDLSFHEVEAFQNPLGLVVGLCASYEVAWDGVASKEIAVSEVEAFPAGAGVGSGQVGHQGGQWMVLGAQLQDQVRLLENLKGSKNKNVNKVTQKVGFYFQMFLVELEAK